MNYNGWHNYETWLVNVHLTNNQKETDYWTNKAYDILVAVKNRPSDFPDPWIKDNTAAKLTLLSAMMEEITDQSYKDLEKSSYDNLFCGLLGSALENVEWDEIAQHFVDSACEIFKVEAC